MTNLQIYKLKNLHYGFAAMLFIFIYLLICKFVYFKVHAQNAISLSITPPLLEVTIAPAKEYRHTFTIANSGGKTILKPKIVYFTPLGDNGEVELSNIEAPDWIRYAKEDIILESEAKKDFAILVTPPKGILESDHFLTLTLTTQAPTDLNIGQNTSNFQAEIGANILITISNDGKPKKDASILEFNSQKYVDSIFGEIDYNLIVKNTGSSYIKPVGTVKTNHGDILRLASVNILPNYSRKIPCINNETIINCKLKNLPIIGKVVSTVEFTIDEEPKVYKKSVTTYVFPYYLVFALSITMVIVLLTLKRTKFIFKLWPRRKRK